MTSTRAPGTTFATKASDESNVEVRRMPDGAARLFINGIGCASWPSHVEVYGTGANGWDYAQEVARCIRRALCVEASLVQADTRPTKCANDSGGSSR